MYRAKINGREEMISVGADGNVFMHVLGRGQVILANSDDAYQFCLSHVHVDDLENIVRRLKPSTTANHYMQSHLAG